MRVLAIGATGFIGPHVVRLLVDQGHEVAVLHRAATAPGLPQGVHSICGNRDRLKDSVGDIDRFDPDVVLDLILYTERQARDLVEVLRGRAGRLVAVSSADVYRNYDGLRGKTTAPPDAVPLSEGSPLRESRYPYRGQDLALSHSDEYEKVLVEQILMSQSDVPATVLRFPAVYGPGDRQHRLQPYLRRMADRGASVLLDEGQAGWRWTRGFVGNVAAAAALAVMDARSAGRVYNVGDEPTLSEREWVEHIGTACAWLGDVVVTRRSELPAHLKQSLDWRYDIWTDTAQIRAELGYRQPVATDEALRVTLDWERQAAD